MSWTLGVYTHNIMNNIISMSRYSMNVEVKRPSYEDIENILISVYKDTYNITNLDELINYIQSNAKQNIIEKLNYNIDDVSDNNFRRLLKEQLDIQLTYYDYKHKIYKILSLVDEPSYNNPIVNEIEEIYRKEDDEDFRRYEMYDTPLSFLHHAKYDVSLIICLYDYVMSIIFLVVLGRCKKEFLENNELLQLADNIYSQIRNEEEAKEKFFEIYDGLYSESLKNIYNSTTNSLYRKQVIDILVKLSFNNMEKCRNHLQNTIIDNLTLEGIFNNIDSINYDILNKMMYDIQNTNFYEEFNLLSFYYVAVLLKYRKNLSGRNLIYLLWSWWDIESDSKNRIKNDKLLREKERLLRGDFSKEIKIEQEKLLLSNVRDGIEFENYLKHLFEELGCRVEMTKASGDQGADLIIYHDNTKIVVQAKFYSSTVGNKAVQEVVSSIKYYEADRGIVVTNNYYTKSAIELAEANDIELWDKDILDKMISKLNGSI